MRKATKTVIALAIPALGAVALMASAHLQSEELAAPAAIELAEAQLPTWTVADGDTLESIARRVYGDPSMAWIIYEGNRDTVSDSSPLAPGTVLRLPNVS